MWNKCKSELSIVIVLCFFFALVACQKRPTWQEQYDLGMRYLSESNYEEAILAFTMAIEIDPNNALAYVGRADAYVQMDVTEGDTAAGSLAAAQADYEAALTLDDTLADAYLGLAEVYQKQGKLEEAVELLEGIVSSVLDERIQSMLMQIENNLYKNISILFEETYGPENYANISAQNANGDVLWTYETPRYMPAELSRVSEIGRKDNVYYLIQDRSIVALDIQTGDMLWTNDDYGGAGTGIVMGENAIYLCGQYGPDFYAIDYDGETLARIEQFDSNYYWARKLEISDDQIMVYLYGGATGYDFPVVFYVDADNYTVKRGSL